MLLVQGVDSFLAAVHLRHGIGLVLRAFEADIAPELLVLDLEAQHLLLTAYELLLELELLLALVEDL